MYWFKPFVKCCGLAVTALLLCCCYACKPAIKENGAALRYFDLKAYFQADSARLTRLNHPINKTVNHNGVSETKKVFIANWGQEFGLFTSADINKPAFKDSYNIQQTKDRITYRAKFPELKTREIIISKTDGKVTAVYIRNYIHNLLYHTTEKLTYIPGSYYLIEKDQHVKVMGANNYLIKGIFN